MRTDQYMGLNDWAEEFIRGEQVVHFVETKHKKYPDGTEKTYGPYNVYVSNIQRAQYDTIDGAFGNSFPLNKYTFEDGRMFFEYVQAEPWSSGPCFFIALRNAVELPIPESLWKDEEIESA